VIRIKGKLQMPENLHQVLTVISKKKQEKESTGYLVRFDRLIDPVTVATLYGLYKSAELPPIEEEEILLEKSYEFNVDISPFANLLNHFLFCLWVKKNGAPDKSSDIVKYREELYRFVTKLLDVDYYRTVLIPFYLKKADQSEDDETSFLYRMWNSDNVGLKLEDYSPEFLSLEFSSAQEEFISSVVAPLKKED
jgi:hypothetical protein